MPYFGKWPFWMPFFLESCRGNPDIDWLFFTDCGIPENLPENVRIRAFSFKDYCDFVSRRLGIDFAPENPYKLCDVKPFYGFLHENDLAGFDFWGFGDIDVIYGRLRDHFTAERLARHDLLSCHARRISGHLTLVRNIPRMNRLFERIPDWKGRLCGPHQAVDESAFSHLFIKHKNFPKPLFKLFGWFNPLRRSSDFTETYNTPGLRIPWADGSGNFPSCWFWRDGRLTTDRDGKREFPYLHFLYWKKEAWNALTPSPRAVLELARQLGWRIGENGFEALEDVMPERRDGGRTENTLLDTRENFLPGNSLFCGAKIALLPYPNLGDTAVALRLAWIFHQAGARVHFFSNLFQHVRDYFPWAEISASDDLEIPALSAQFDLVVSDVFWLSKSVNSDSLKCNNVAYVTDRKRADHPDFGDRVLCVRGRNHPGADRPFCLDSRAGLSMVQWIDRYARDVFGLDCKTPIPVKCVSGSECPASARIAIFPMSSRSRKDYFLRAWAWLAKRLVWDGWIVDFVCLPHEREKIQKIAGGGVRSFPDIRALMDYLSGCAAVIGNDSGGGHLASLMGIKTLTLTHREQNFAWRPGFCENHVLSPLIRADLLGRHSWRLFIPVWRIPAILGTPGESLARGVSTKNHS